MNRLRERWSNLSTALKIGLGIGAVVGIGAILCCVTACAVLIIITAVQEDEIAEEQTLEVEATVPDSAAAESSVSPTVDPTVTPTPTLTVEPTVEEPTERPTLTESPQPTDLPTPATDTPRPPNDQNTGEDANPTEESPTVFGYTLAQRKTIYYQLVAAEDRALREAEVIYPTPDALNPNYSQEAWEEAFTNQMDYFDERAEEYRQEVMEQFDLTPEQMHEIINEGLQNNWPMPTP